MQPNSRQIAMWNDTGRTWVTLQAVLDDLFQPLNAAIIDVIDTSHARRVLDIGCGAGGSTFDISRALGSGSHVTGIDISRPLIEAAKARAAQNRDGTVSFLEADAQTFSADEKFDAVVSRLGVMFFDDPVAAFRNLRATMHPSGRLVVLCWRSLHSNPFMTEVERTLAPRLPALPTAVDDVPGQFGLASRERAIAILEASQWQSIEVDAIDLPCRFHAEHLPAYATQMGSYGRVRETLDDDARARADKMAISALEAFVSGADVRLTAALWRITAHA